MEEKLKINIYKGLPMVMEKINTVALAAVIGRTDVWIYNKLRHLVIKGKEKVKHCCKDSSVVVQNT